MIIKDDLLEIIRALEIQNVELRQLAEKLGISTAKLNRLALKLPSVWFDDISLWLAQFTAAGVSSERTNFAHVASKLERSLVSTVLNILPHPP